MIARRGGRGGHAVSVRADTALLKFGDRVKRRNCPRFGAHLRRRFATATATNILRHTCTHNQINNQATS
eukprot:scaffold45189_cov69-Phaeocystis_antarctica.AAC.1